jgi:DNA polymerase-1
MSCNKKHQNDKRKESMMTKKPIIIVDGSSYLFRAYHAMPDLTNANGQATGAIYGVINMVKRLKKDYKDHHIIMVFDSKGKTTRHNYFPDYKANRPPMPDDLASQIPYIHKFIKNLGLPIVMDIGIEADDIIGTLAKHYANKGEHVVISTGDKDMAQLVNDKVSLVNTMTETAMDCAGVKEKFGVTPEQIIDYLALMGDKVDNIPGIPKVGPKTAAKWLNAYNTIENLCAHADEIKGKIGEALREHIDQLPLSKRLVTIDCDLDLGLTPEDLHNTEENTEALRKLFKELSFNRWLNALSAPSKAVETKTTDKIKPQTQLTLHEIKTQQDWKNCLETLKQAPQISIMMEGSDKDPLKSSLVALALQTEKQSFLISLEAANLLNTGSVTFKKIADDLNSLFNQKNIEWLTYDAKTMIKLCHGLGLSHPDNIFDTLLASYILRELTGKNDLESCAKYWLSDSELIDPTHQKTDRHHLSHACEIIFELYRILSNDFTSKASCKKLYSDMDLPIAKILAQIEINGVLIDSTILHKQSQAIAIELETLTAQIYELAQEEFTIESPKQLGVILFEKLELPVIKKTPKGAPSTAEPVLTELALTYELPALILQYRSLAKLKSTYTDKLPLEVNPKTHRIHTTYLETGTSTGRLASMNPNLQNIPIRTERGREVRLAFIAPDNHKIVAADYSQIELRIMADLSQDPKLLEAFSTNQDVHRHTAATVLGINPEEVTFEQRRHAKAVNFGLMYGMSAFGLAKQLGIERKEAQNFIDAYFEKYPGIKSYMDTTHEVAKEQEYVETLFGRRIAVPEINSKNHMRAQGAQRAAINAPLQGSAADIIKQAMINFSQWQKDNDSNTLMIMQVHDELVFQVPEAELEKTKSAIKQAMESAYALSVPLIVDIGEGNNWQEAH